MSEVVTAVGLVFVLEGLIYAIWPGGMKQMMAMMQDTPEETMRTTGLVAIAIGVGIVWLARNLIAGS